jgi:hypothetical protein
MFTKTAGVTEKEFDFRPTLGGPDASDPKANTSVVASADISILPGQMELPFRPSGVNPASVAKETLEGKQGVVKQSSLT